jgi:hypothetical protein
MSTATVNQNVNPNPKLTKQQELQMLQTFKVWCIANAIPVRAKHLITWDEKLNNSALANSFGSDEDLRKYGLQVKFSQLLSKYRDKLSASTGGATIPGTILPASTIDQAKLYLALQVRYKDANVKVMKEGLKQEDALKIFTEVWMQGTKVVQ